MEQTNSGFSLVLGKSIFYEFINFKYEDDAKPVIVFLHEGLGCSAQWKDFPAIISETLDLPVLLYDRYGYGKSEIITEKRKTEFLNSEALHSLPQLLKNLNLSDRKILLFGHSDGGSIALIYAAAYPQNVIGIVSEAAHVFIEDISVQGIMNAVSEFQNGVLKERLQKYHGTNTDKMVETWTQAWLTPEAKNWNIEKLLQNIKCPILAIQGTDDNYGTFLQLESIKKNTGQNTELLYIENCGHIPHHHAREKVLTATIEFIKKAQ